MLISVRRIPVDRLSRHNGCLSSTWSFFPHVVCFGERSRMQLARYRDTSGVTRVGILEQDRLSPLTVETTLTSILAADSPAEAARSAATGSSIESDSVAMLPPIENQEVWAAGVTYKRSQTARMEESESAASCYDRVYQSPRPEIFFKATPHRVRGTGQDLFIRGDSAWNVPEPEIALVLNERLELVGFTIGNDMSSRAIEGDNPLYLPQAKTYDACCGLGPVITLAEFMPPPEAIQVDLEVYRDGAVVFQGHTSGAEMARTFAELIGYLGRCNSFPSGAFLLTGTGIVPESDFTLNHGDQMRIDVSGVGTLVNGVHVQD